MPLSDLKIATSVQFTLTETVTGWADATQGENALTFNVGDVDFDDWDQAYGVKITLPGGTDQDIDLTALLNFLGESVVFASVLALGVQCALSSSLAPDGLLVLAPSVVNGFDAMTAGLTVKPGGSVVITAPATDAGYTVDSTHKMLNVLNTGADSIIATIAVVGTTT